MPDYSQDDLNYTTVNEDPLAGQNFSTPKSSSNPQLDAIIAAINKTPGASGSAGGQFYGGGGTAPVAQPAASTSSVGVGTAPPPPNPWLNNEPFGGTSPWLQNVQAGTTNPDGTPGTGTNFATSQNPNLNFITEDAAKRVNAMFGSNLLSQNMGGPNPPPPGQYGLDFGAGDPQNAGQVAFWLARGDNPNDILARLQAGIAPPQLDSTRGRDMGRAGFEANWNPDPIARNLQPGQVSSFVPGTKDGAAFNPTGYLQGAKPSTHLGKLGGYAPTAPAAPDNRSFANFSGNFGGNSGFGGGFGQNPGFTPQGIGGGQGWQGPGSMGGFANFANQMPLSRAYGGGTFGNNNASMYRGPSYSNPWYYPGYEPNMQGRTGTYANQRRGMSLGGSPTTRY